MLGEQQLSAVAQVANVVNQELANRLRVLQIVAEKISPELMKQPTRLEAVMREYPVFQDGFNGGTLVTGIDGVAITATQHAGDQDNSDRVDTDSVAAALKQGHLAIGQPVIGKNSHAPILSMAVPIRNARGQVIGALSGNIKLTQPGFLDVISRSQYGQSPTAHREAETAKAHRG